MVLRIKMVVVRAVTFNLISTIGYALWGTTTPLAEKAGSIYECGLACDSLADCGGFSWDGGKCQLVVRLTDAEDRLLEFNLYRMSTFRGKRIIDLHKPKEQLTYPECKDICEGLGMMMLPPPITSREQMTLAIRRRGPMFIGGQIVGDGFKDEFGKMYQNDGTVITWVTDQDPYNGTESVMLIRVYEWTSIDQNDDRNSHLMCME